MRYTRPFVWALAFASVALPVCAQVPRLQFLNRLNDDSTVTGSVTVRVSTDPILRPRGIKPGIEVDGELKETADTLPWSYTWDTSGLPDGKHVIRLVLVNVVSHETGMVDEMRVRTSNRSEPAPHPHPREDPGPGRPIERPKTNSPADTQRSQPLSRDERRADGERRPRRDDSPEPVRGRPDDLSANARAGSTVNTTEYDADVLRSANALDLPASSLQVETGRLLIGRHDASLTVFDPASRDGWTVKAPVTAGDVLAAARASDTVYWLCGDTGLEKSSTTAAARWLFAYREKDRKVQSIDLTGAPVSVRRLAVWRGKLFLTGSAGGFVLDPKGGVLGDLDAVLPAEIAAAVRGSDLTLIAHDGHAVLVAVGRGGRSVASRRGPALSSGELLAWAATGDRWTPVELPSLAEVGVENVRLVAASPERLALCTNSGISGLSLAANRGDLQNAEFPHSDQTGRSASQLTVSGSHVWCIRGSALFHADVETGRQDAFLPWNMPGHTPKVLAADGETLWVGTGQNIRRLDVGRPDTESGYAGFIRARLGDDSPDGAMADASHRLAQEIDSWQGTPYLWGGETRNGVDCSGFVMKAFQGVGVRLDHGSDYLRTCRQGARIRDELQFGDVLVFPGHCAIYTGDGTTAETVDKAVGRATIWRRTDVVVRRFLGASAVDTRAYASRSTGYPKAAKKTHTRKHARS